VISSQRFYQEAPKDARAWRLKGTVKENKEVNEAVEVEDKAGTRPGEE